MHATKYLAKQSLRATRASVSSDGLGLLQTTVMKILMVYPQTPDTFWSFKHVLPVISKKAAFPPLGLITVAAMLPPDWEVKLVDTNVRRLHDEELLWADYVMLSGMIVHKDSAHKIID